MQKRSDQCRLHAANENFKEELNKKNFEIGMLQERVKAQ